MRLVPLGHKKCGTASARRLEQEAAKGDGKAAVKNTGADAEHAGATQQAQGEAENRPSDTGSGGRPPHISFQKVDAKKSTTRI